MTVYFVKSGNFVKIGYSTTPTKRVKSLQTGTPNELKVLFLMPGSAAVEKEFHSVFSELHHRNEWYVLSGRLKVFVDTAVPLFLDYTQQYLTGDKYQDERDWEYWKTRAELAEAENKRLQDMNSVHQPSIKSPVLCRACAREFSTIQALNAHGRFCKGTDMSSSSVPPEETVTNSGTGSIQNA